MRLPRTALVVVGTVSIVVAGLAFNHLITHAVSDDALPDKKTAQPEALFNDSGTTERNRLRDPANGDKTAVANDPAVPVVNRPREGMPLDISPDEAKRRGEALSAVKQLASVDLKEMPLAKAIREITAKLPIRVKFDQKAIDDDGTVSLDDPITVSTENEPVESILFEVLKPRGLTWIPRGDNLVITTQTVADANLETIGYDVTDLVVAEDGKADFSQLKNSITQTIEPDSWTDVGGDGSVSEIARERAALLIVRQSFATQRKIANMLTALQRTGLAAPYSNSAEKIKFVLQPIRPCVGGSQWPM